jgi:hypothetical protein
MSGWVEPHYDPYAFAGRRPKAVTAASRISFADYQHMHIQRRVRTQERRLPTPRWAVSNELLQLVLVTYLEERFYCKPVHGATLQQRLATVRRASMYYAPRKKELLNAWLDKYQMLAAKKELNDGGKKLRNLEIQIQNLDTDLVLTEKGHAEVIVSMIYLYYRLGWDSVTVAEQLGLKSPHVRRILRKLHRTAEWIESGRGRDRRGRSRNYAKSYRLSH